MTESSLRNDFPMAARRSGSAGPLAGGSSDGGLGYALERAARVWRAEVSAELTPYKVTVPQFFVLIAVLRADRRGGPPTQRDIGQRLGMDPNTASAVIRSLEREGLLDRVAHPSDRRAWALGLSESGRSLARTCARNVRQVNDRFFGPLSAEQGDTLRATLATLTASSGAAS